MTLISGWFALLMFIASFYLAIRLPFLNSIFGGLKLQLRCHHLIAVLSVTFMCWHSAQLFWNFRNHLNLLFDWNNIGILSGWITLVGMALVLPFAFYRIEIPYRLWRFIHLVTTGCLITAFIHTFVLFEPNNYIQWTFFLFVLAVGSFGLLFSVILPNFSLWGKKYQISEIVEIRPKLFLLKLQSNSNQLQHFQFDAGHFIYLKFSHTDFSSIWHPFTIISKPSDIYLELFIKARGKDTNRLGTISPPSPVRVIAPFGTIFWQSDENQLWIANGLGVAIFLAAIRSFPFSFRSKIHFICCDSSKQNMVFSEEFDDCMRKNVNFTWEPYIGTGIQFIADFDSKSIDIENVQKVRICGHPLFQKKLKTMLVTRGMKSKNISLEGLL